MDKKLLSIIVALESRRRGSTPGEAVAIAEETLSRISELPDLDLMGFVMIIDQVLMEFGYPAV